MLNDLQMTNATQEKNKKQVYLNACTKKDQNSSSKALFYSSTMAKMYNHKILHRLFTRARELERNESGEHKRMREQGEIER